MQGDVKTVQIVAEYVGEVARLAKTGKTTEHSFRGALAVLIDALAPGLKAVNEPKRTDCDAPDYIVQDRTGLAVFYVEAKDLGDGDLDGKRRTGHKEQFDRYKAALDTIIFTDYLDFRLYRHGQPVSAVRIADWDGEGKVSGKPGAYADFARLVADAAAGEPQRIEGAKRLAELMAGKARMLQTAALKFLKPLAEAWDGAKDGERPQRTPLLDMMLDMRTMLMPDVGAAEFACYRDAGRALRETHLMRDAPPPLSEPTARFPVPGDNMVDAVRWGNSRVWINATQYFDNVPLAAWEQAIGGYQPAQKWLKDRKGRALTQDDLRHYQRIILSLLRTREIMNSLADSRVKR